MKSKSVFILLFAIVILGILLGIFFNIKDDTFLKKEEVIPIETDEGQADTKEIPDGTFQEEPTFTPYPTPTFSPLTESVKSVDSDKIIISGKGGEMIIPKDPSIVKVFKKSGNSLITADFEEVKVGQQVTLKIIRPGKEAELILE